METKAHGAAFFAAMNTADGFKSYFREIFGGFENIYIIKGGPGTGKSRFMREAAERAEEKGMSVERFYCSSDPSSIDGIIIYDISTVLLDGTSPHAYEPKYPGVKEKLIDLGEFWERGKLCARKSEIEELGRRKSKLYQSVYGYLKIIKQYDEIIKSDLHEAFEEEKLDDAIFRMKNTLGEGSGSGTEIRIRSGVTADGEITLGTYAAMAKKRYALENYGAISGIYLKKLYEKTRETNRIVISYNPYDSEYPDALYYPEHNVSFYIGAESDFDEKPINMKRFVCDETLKPYKPRLRAVERLRRDAIKNMYLDYSCIKRLHSELESIYVSAMDFEAKESFCKEFISELLK
ncbi:MAG: hypothetical protein E7678_02150 [Ruminococcaceae bacterium]|nr:hypothetical protein [Oscillospiraceae bacterium]